MEINYQRAIEMMCGWCDYPIHVDVSIKSGPYHINRIWIDMVNDSMSVGASWEETSVKNHDKQYKAFSAIGTCAHVIEVAIRQNAPKLLAKVKEKFEVDEGKFNMVEGVLDKMAGAF